MRCVRLCTKPEGYTKAAWRAAGARAAPEELKMGVLVWAPLTEVELYTFLQNPSVFFERFGFAPHVHRGRSFRIAAVVLASYHRHTTRLVYPTAMPTAFAHSSRGKILSIRRIFRPDEGGLHAISISVRALEIDRLPSRLQFTPIFTPCKAWQHAALTSSPHQHDQQT